MGYCKECANSGTRTCSLCSNYMGVPDRFEPIPKTNYERLLKMSNVQMAQELGRHHFNSVDEWFDWLMERYVK